MVQIGCHLNKYHGFCFVLVVFKEIDILITHSGFYH